MKKVDLIVAATDDELNVGSRFKEEMEAFSVVALETVSQLRQELTETKLLFNTLVAFYRFKSKTGTSVSPVEFFDIWAGFCDGFTQGWQQEQRAQARLRLELAQGVQRHMREQAKVKKVSECACECESECPQ